jgi:hypothetical protein
VRTWAAAFVIVLVGIALMIVGSGLATMVFGQGLSPSAPMYLYPA